MSRGLQLEQGSRGPQPESRGARIPLISLGFPSRFPTSACLSVCFPHPRSPDDAASANPTVLLGVALARLDISHHKII